MKPTCQVIRPGESYRGAQGLTYLAGLSGKTAGSRAICMTFAEIPPGWRAKTHLHRGIETAAFLIEGEAEMYFGERLQEKVTAKAGEYIYIPGDMPHLVINRSNAICKCLVAHTSPDDQDGIVLLPELDGLV